MTDTQSSETRREAATRRVMSTLARTSVSRPLPVRLADGSTPIVVVLPEDDVTEIDARRARLGGSVNVFVAYPDHLLLIEWWEGLEADDVADVASNVDVHMIVEWLRSTESKTGSIRVRNAKNVAPRSQPRVEEIEYVF